MDAHAQPVLARYFFERVIHGPWDTAEPDVQFRVELVEEQIRVFFQCTSSRDDWKRNLDFPAIAYRRSPVPWMAHRGFVRAFKQAKDAIWRRIDELAKGHTIRQFIVVGYSMGAAYATLFHEDFRYRYRYEFGFPYITADLYSYVYGGPRIAFGILPANVKGRFATLFRYETRGDIVPHVPPVLFGFRHVGTRIKIGPKRFLPRLLDHAPEAYLACWSDAF